MTADQALDALQAAARARLALRREQSQQGQDARSTRVAASRALADAEIIKAADLWAKLDASEAEAAQGEPGGE